MARLLAINLAITCSLLCACTTQLSSAYDSSIDADAQSFEKDFLAFVAERQSAANTPAFAYGNYQKTYAGFAARVAAMELRAANDPGGVSCGEALSLVKQIGAGGKNFPAIDASSSQTSCIVQEVAAVQRQMARLQQQDSERCAPTAAPGLCATLFPPGLLEDMLPNGHGDAPLVRATIVSIDNLVGFEQDLKPARKKGE